jgi:hypothetical protein
MEDRMKSEPNSTSAEHPARADNRPGQLAIIQRFDWGDIFTGTKAQLMAVGIASQGLFPGDPGRGSTMCSYFADGSPSRRGGVAGRKAVLTIKRCGKKFSVRVSRAPSDAAHEDRKGAAVPEAEVLQEIDALTAALERAREKLADMTVRRRGTWADPGMDEVIKRTAQSLARFKVGDAVLSFVSDEALGTEATVIAGYDTHVCNDDQGAYLRSNGERFDYRAGYLIKVRGSDETNFCPAHMLTGDDCKPSHLRLVAAEAAGTHARAFVP